MRMWDNKFLTKINSLKRVQFNKFVHEKMSDDGNVEEVICGYGCCFCDFGFLSFFYIF
jgi:hypothetical protein